MNATKWLRCSRGLADLGFGLAAALAGCGLCAPACAQSMAAIPAIATMADPTLPRGTARPGAPVSSPPREAATAATAATVAAAPGNWPHLQAVQIPRQGLASAIVDGRIVHIGEKIGEATLTAIGAHGIALRAARYEQHVALTPGISRTAILQDLPGPPATADPALAVVVKDIR